MTSPDPAPAPGIVYGPVASRRLGRSLGVNLLPAGIKVCGFNCNYCECGWTFDITDEDSLGRHDWPSANRVGGILEERLKRARLDEEPIDVVTLSGNGEPTLHPDFDGVVTEVLAARDRSWPGLRVVILSNGANLHRARVLGGLNLLDGRFMKLDAGSDETFLEMNAPTMPIGVWDIIDGLKRLKDCVVQAMFTRGRRDNTGDSAVLSWINAVAQVNPRGVQLYTIERPPADARALAVDRGTLESIRDRLIRKTGIEAVVY